MWRNLDIFIKLIPVSTYMAHAWNLCVMIIVEIIQTNDFFMAKYAFVEETTSE